MPVSVKPCPLCRLMAALKSWASRRQKAGARVISIDQAPRPSAGGLIRQAHGPLPSREQRESWLGFPPEKDDGWRRVDPPEEFRKIVPSDWRRTRRHTGWLR